MGDVFTDKITSELKAGAVMNINMQQI